MRALAMIVLAGSLLGQSVQANIDVSELSDPKMVGMSQERLVPFLLSKPLFHND